MAFRNFENYREFVRSSIVIEKKETMRGDLRYILYLIFAKPPGESFFDRECLHLLLDKIDAADKEIQKARASYGKKTESGLYLSFEDLCKVHNIPLDNLPGKPLGFISANILDLKDIPRDADYFDIYNSAEKDGIENKDSIAEIISFWPLDFAGERHIGRGVGGEAISFVLNDLKSSCNVKWVYMIATDEAEEILIKKYSFEKTSDILICRKF